MSLRIDAIVSGRTALLAAPLALAFALTSVADVAVADPPPWAPAHGWRAKQEKSKDRSRVEVVPVPFGIGAGHCNRTLLGQVLGGVGGAAVGSQIGSGDGRLVATAAGAIVGVLIGGAIGRSMDQVDQACIGQVLEHAEDGRPVAWRNPDDVGYSVVPVGTYRGADGAYCREYTTRAVIAGRNETVYGRACRQPDGSWRVANAS